MTVSCLWKALDSGGSGKAVDARQLVDPASDPDTCSDLTKPQRLAIDLSIWICESLTTVGTNEHNANPALHLVFTRTMKLLKLGLDLVFVLEGKRRIRDFTVETADKFRKRRSGTAFHKACQDCKTMLELLGVPVVKAKSEGEALCALLSQRGIVDGVISNDGDCLMFGAKVVYTKYSNENLDNGQVIRYDAGGLYAEVEATMEEEVADKETRRIKLSRDDLISFAVLTGSDLVGAGLPKVGHKKALRFIKHCQKNNPLSQETASLDELKSWAFAARADVPLLGTTESGSKCCSWCGHSGTKHSHEKDGCLICGTQPGEKCYHETTEERFRKSLRAKALAMLPKFDPTQVNDAYRRPNDNQLPSQFVSMSVTLDLPSINLTLLTSMPMIIKGNNLEGSRAFVLQQVSQLLSRRELQSTSPLLLDKVATATNVRVERDRPIPKKINRSLTQNQISCFEIDWIVNATATDENGEGIDGFEYTTIEPQNLVARKYHKLVEAFHAVQVERAKQGDGMKTHRREFLENVLFRNTEHQQHLEESKNGRKPDKKRGAFFQDNHQTMIQSCAYQAKQRKLRRRERKAKEEGDDVGHLLRFASKRKELSPKKIRCDSIKHKAHASTMTGRCQTPINNEILGEDCFLFCTMGSFEVMITPISSNHGAYPPNHIFVRAEKSWSSKS